MKFTKYHALGNDYVVIHPGYFKDEVDRDVIRLICAIRTSRFTCPEGRFR
jgi:diaminopimelate epimerase